LFAALALEYADRSAPCRVQHRGNQLRLGVAPSTATVLYCYFTGETCRAEIIHRFPRYEQLNADRSIPFRKFVLKVKTSWL
jgi:hypothetical protein